MHVCMHTPLQAGVVLYVCLCGYEPFFGVTEKDLIAANKKAVFEFPAAEWEEVSDGAKDLVSCCFRCWCLSEEEDRRGTDFS